MLLNCGVGEDLRVPWTARRSNQSTLKEISPEYSLEGLMLKLKLQYFGHLMGRADSFEKTLMLGKIEGRKRRGPQKMSSKLMGRTGLFPQLCCINCLDQRFSDFLLKHPYKGGKINMIISFLESGQ